jgi:hypothetical protein
MPEKRKVGLEEKVEKRESAFVFALFDEDPGTRVVGAAASESAFVTSSKSVFSPYWLVGPKSDWLSGGASAAR